MGAGYAEISRDVSKRDRFGSIVNTYGYPIVAHNAPFDRKFLVHYGWLDEDHECYDSIRAIKYANPYLFSYSLGFLLSFYGIDRPLTHVALDDVNALCEVILKANPDLWVPLYKVAPSELKKFAEATASIEGQSEIFKGKRIVFTGASPFPRILMKEIATKCGAIVTGNVSSKTDLLVCGEAPGSKLDRARQLEVQIETDEWFIDAVSKDLDLGTTASIARRSTAAAVEAKEFIKNSELKGKSVNIALMPSGIQRKVEDILINHMEVAKVNKSSNGYKVDFIIHWDDGEYVLIEKAKELQIQTIPLSKFNRMILSN